MTPPRAFSAPLEREWGRLEVQSITYSTLILCETPYTPDRPCRWSEPRHKCRAATREEGTTESSLLTVVLNLRQKATFHQKVEKWESDSDSDASSDEEDLAV